MVTVDLGNANFYANSFSGSITFDILPNNDCDFVQQFVVLLRFLEYLGLGANVRFGYGAVKVAEHY
jgi:CRISPR/Cas system endoribonuclease Cas6 (RAMP superfamily)